MITRLGRLGAKAPALVERELGYGAGRLSQGYWIAVLKEALRADQIQFAGLTLRSGGREGLPNPDPALDRLRTEVHKKMLHEYGAADVAAMLRKLATDPRNLSGSDRIVKILPVTRNVGTNPAQEYPMGGGGPQFILLQPHKFLIAVEVGPDFKARTAAGWDVSVAETAPYDDRARLARYLAGC